MNKSIKSTILNVKPYIPGKPIEEVKREYGLDEVIKLASNENPYGPSPKVRKAVTEAVKDLNRYPDGGCYELRQVLAQRLKVKPEQLMFGNGSDELIVLAIRALVNSGDRVVMASPSFLVYSIASTIAGADIQAVPLKNFRYDLKAMRKAVNKRTKIVFLGNPDNPAGSYFTKKDIIDFCTGLPSGTLVFLDEAYYEFVRAADYVDSIKLLKTHKNIFITRTFSKMYGLAGLRIGYGIGDVQLIDWFNRIREPFNVNSLAQAGAIACLNDQAFYDDVARKLEAQRAYLYKEITKLGLSYVESYTNFVLIDVGQPSKPVAQRLLERGVIIRDMSVWGMTQYIRVTIGAPKENRQFIRTLGDVL